jgi:hypothetical protein
VRITSPSQPPRRGVGAGEVDARGLPDGAAGSVAADHVAGSDDLSVRQLDAVARQAGDPAAPARSVGRRPALQRVLPLLAEECFEERFEFALAKLLSRQHR